MLIKIYEDNPNEREMLQALKVLRKGGIVIYPTDTVYAMGCDSMNVTAGEKLCQLKGIDAKKNDLSIICYDISDISKLSKLNNNTFKLLKNNLPGPFTFILNITTRLPRVFQRKTVGVRIPDNNIIRTLVKELGNPILTTSVKDDDEIIEYTTDPSLIHEKYEKLVDLVIDGGSGGLEGSTIVDCTGDEPEIIRQGKGNLIL